MRYLSIPLLCVAAVFAAAQDKRPALPDVPAGFDEGRVHLVQEVADNPIGAGALVERVFEDADLHELAELVFAHLTATEKTQLDARLELDGALPRARDADGVHKLFADKEYKPAKVATAIAKLLEEQKYTLGEVAAWLYARGLNFRLLQSGLNGERLDCFKLPRELRAMVASGKGAHELFTKGLWEYNLLDGREQPGGVYDGVQLVENLMALGWGEEEFARATGHQDVKDFDSTARQALQWGDPALFWRTIELRAPEAELSKIARAYYAHDDRKQALQEKVLRVAVRRAGAVKRWFRTGGPGLIGVYEGPWPGADGKQLAPVAEVREMEEPDAQEFFAQLSDGVKQHFRKSNQTMLICVYQDGSGRAILRLTGRKPVNYGPASPPGNVETQDKLYEGRVTLRGRGAYMKGVYSDGNPFAPAEFELVNLQLKAKGALLVADIDDGVQLTPILLRRTSRLVEAP